jgi:rhodanese-related sulfurtransferase
MIAASILKSIGLNGVVNVKEGMEGILRTDLPIFSRRRSGSIQERPRR